ncbi:CD209 antigen-like protein E [Archocentrus centrarchus]|uniref:CD209 antigen-like protein E n=1 Tax=Archocentrus centrarchus TaxID=63155 RepID=UPI0011E9F550|nr:CD209 antigen-like protein E [Archocentrus centrarchus]
MEEIYVNAEDFKSDNPIPSTVNPKGPRSSTRSFYSGVTLSLGLLSVLLLIGLITLGVYLHDSTASLSAMSSKLSSMNEERDHLKANLSTMRNKLSSVIENRNLLNASLTEKIEELERLQNLSKQKKTCPAGWRKFSRSCYLLSQSSDSWDAGRNKCRERGADLAVIDSAEEQDFLATFTQRPTWIGLTDTQEEGKWKWVDGTPLTLKYWAPHQPDNGGGDPKWGEEDCAQIRTLENTLWNDLSCGSSLLWVCEKVP